METNQNLQQPPKKLLNIDEVKAITGFSTTTIYKHIKLGIFPKPKNCGSRAVRWRLTDIENYINE
ncbi:AlpA family phage regulatory protein [Lonepinella koalarum]|uniref:helix-turn-helix transcriptional regulator n=1 Tax=Lonepinella koalarum TaxID=53417 RepID=UPI0011E47082|nr:AlpA family phage regulatory protein [Lonepinella koalarum]TYG33714.1 AlpA family phage regulatory protein [Lonepinella koalarum]